MINYKINLEAEFLEEKYEKIEYYKEPFEKLYNKYFEKTAPLKNKSKNNELIVDLIDETYNIIGHIFLKADKDIGYEEYFIWKDLEFFSQLSKNISFIFPPKEGKNVEKLIGYRFYEEDPTKYKDSQNYFTLVLKDQRKYDILEINSNIKDNNGNSFIDESLNCHKIMQKIIKNKFKDKIIYNYPNTIIELLGFYYSLMYNKVNQNKNIKFIEPFFPIINNKETMKEAINEKDILNKKIFIEPILFNKHISVLYFKYENNHRINLIFDPSLFHFNSITKDKAVFPKSMRTRLTIFPKFSCQNGPSCSIWFIGQIANASEFGDSIFNEDNDFNYLNLLRMIEYINKYMEIDSIPLIAGNTKKIQALSNSTFNISEDKRCFVSHKIAFAPFLSIFNTIKNFGIIDLHLYFLIDEIKDKLEKIRNFICDCKFNKEYSEYLGENSDIKDELIEKFKKDFMELKNQYKIFIISYLEEEKNEKDVYNSIELKQKFISLLDKKIKNLISECDWKIYEKEEIKNFYRDKNDIFCQLSY